MKMDNPSIDQQYQAVCRLVLKGQWTEAFKQLHKHIKGSQDQQLLGRLETLENGYRAALQYLVTGGNDPQMNDIYNETQRRLLHITAAVARDRKLRTGMNIFSMSHIEQVVNQEGVENLGHLDELILLLADSREMDEHHFALCDSIFNCVFTSPAIPDDDAQLQLTALIDSMDEHMQAYLVSALTLSSYTYFCERKLSILFHYTSNEWCDEVRARALVGIMLIYNRYPRQVAVFPHLVEQMGDMLEACSADVHALYQEWIMTCSTSELHNVIENKLMPALLKGKHMDTAQIDMEGAQAHVIKIDASDPGSDPDPHRRSALFDFIRLLRYGADTNFHTFASMKRFDFFMAMGHWLMPFTPKHPLVRRATIGSADDFCNTIMLGTNMCSSDMYSLCSMLSLTGGQTREKLFSSMTNQVNFEEEMDDEERREAMREAVAEHMNLRRRIRGYMHDWYRLMMLHPAKNELDNPFQGSGLYLSPFWKPMMNDAQFLLGAAKFYAGIERYSECIEMMRRYLKLVPGDADALCILGQTYIKTDTYRAASECFRRAILAGGDEETCLRKLSECQLQMHSYAALIDTMERLSDICPNDVAISVIKATAVMRAGRYADALAQYRAIEILNEDEVQGAQAARGAAWCLFRMRRYEEALERYDRFIDDGDVRHEDLLNRGHVLWAMGRTQEAADSYVSHVHLFTQNNDEGKMAPMRVFDDDVPDLMATAGLQATQVSMMRDYIMSQL